MPGTPQWNAFTLEKPKVCERADTLHPYILDSIVNGCLGLRSVCNIEYRLSSNFSASTLYPSNGHLQSPLWYPNLGRRHWISGGGHGQEKAFWVPWFNGAFKGKNRDNNWWVYLVHTSEPRRAGQSIRSLIDPCRSCGKRDRGADEVSYSQRGIGRRMLRKGAVFEVQHVEKMEPVTLASSQISLIPSSLNQWIK